jgi:hypothetical protein
VRRYHRGQNSRLKPPFGQTSAAPSKGAAILSLCLDSARERQSRREAPTREGSLQVSGSHLLGSHSAAAVEPSAKAALRLPQGAFDRRTAAFRRLAAAHPARLRSDAARLWRSAGCGLTLLACGLALHTCGSMLRFGARAESAGGTKGASEWLHPALVLRRRTPSRPA